MSEHTKGQLHVEGFELVDANDAMVADCTTTDDDTDQANAARLAHCWNWHDPMKNELERLRDVVGEADVAILDALLEQINKGTP